MTSILKHGRERLKRLGWPALITGVILAGFLIRVAMAWAMRYSANGDFGIVALMARHMAQGTDFPVFSYGVAYMGGLEPLLSALASLLLIHDGTAFPINLGTALLGGFLLPLVYVMARDAGSRRAGLIALLYCLVGSDTLLHYSVAPRGGYMSLMVGGTLALWLVCRAVTIENHGRQASKGMFWVIGLSAGVAWWATQLVVVFMGASLIVILLGWRWRLALRGVVPGLAGFVLGSLPWWYWNATHHWVSFDFGSSLGKVKFSEGLASFGDLFLTVVEMTTDSWVGIVRLVVLGGVAAGFIAILATDFFRRQHRQRLYYRLAVVVLIIVMVLFYSTSQFVHAHACRYLLPVVPALAVMIGVVCDRLLAWSRFPWGWVVAILVLPAQILLLPRMGDGVAGDRARWALSSHLEQQVAPYCDGAFVGDYYATHWLNYASRERLCVAALPLERYAPFARLVDLAERRAYLDNYGDLNAFLAGTRGASRSITVDGVPVNYNLTPPSEAWEYVAADEDVVSGVLDTALQSSWDCALPAHSQTNLVFTFRHPLDLAGIRVLSLTGCYPGTVAVEGRSDSTASWVSLLHPVDTTPYFWSGPAVMLDGIQYFQEFRFAAVTGGVTQVRLTFLNQKDYDEVVSLGEILFMRRAARPAASIPSLEACAAVLRNEGVRHAYAPRWLAERLAMAVPGEFVLPVPSLLSRKTDELPVRDSIRPALIAFRNKTGLFMDERDAPRSRVILKQAELRWSERQLGSLVFFAVTGVPLPQHPGGLIYWTEQGCMAANVDKEQAQRLFESSRNTSPAEGLQRLREAVRLYPDHYPARQALVTQLRQAGLVDEALTHEGVLNASTRPATPASIRFGNGVHFLGLTLGGTVATSLTGTSVEVRRGQTLPVTYYWKCPPDIEPVRWAAFIHLVHGRSRLQDDHILLQAIPSGRLINPLFEEIFAESRTITVPETLAPGEYRIDVGLVERRTGQRVKVYTGLDCRHNAVQLPVTVLVR